jgi:hypothetical protein
MQKSFFKKHFQSAIKIKKKKIKRRLAYLYLVSTRNSTVATFVDHRTKQTLSACHIGHVFFLLGMDRRHRRSIEAHKIYGAELRYVLDRYFYKEGYRTLRASRLGSKRPKLQQKITEYRFKFLVYFKGPARYRRVVIKEFTRRFRREHLNEKEPEV